MSIGKLKFGLFLYLFLSLSVAAIPALGASAVIGSVAGSTNATVGGLVLAPNTTLFSGDSLRVNDGAAVVAMGMGSRMVFGRDTVASFEREPEEVTVLLGQGNLSLYHPEGGVGLRVKIGEVSIVAGKGFKTLGEVAMVNGTVVVTAKEGMLKVEGPERSMELTKGNTITITHSVAGSPEPQAAGQPSTHPSNGQVMSIVSLGGIGANVVLSIVNLKRTNDVKTLVTSVNSNAQKADADAISAINAANSATAAATAARAAANAAGAVAAEACKAASPTDPNCKFTAQ